MPYNPDAPNWRTRQHPVTNMLRALAYSGGIPTSDELAALPGGPTVHQEVKAAAHRMHQLHQSGDRNGARAEADATLERLGPILERAPLPEPAREPEPANLDDLAARMFGNH